MLSVTTADPSTPLDANSLARIGAMPAPAARQFRLPLEALGGATAESWVGSSAARVVTSPQISCAENGSHLFGWMTVDEVELADCAGSSERAYSRLRAFLHQAGYPWLLRSWNYINDIHRGDGDNERYRQFCLGRYRAVSAADGFERHLPAATVIGTAQPGMQIWFLAGKTPGVQVENPRQTSAFQYPREYGPASPSFSRATLLRDEGLLLMSGTASVVGHATRHPHDVEAQCGEIFVNIRALLQRASGIQQSTAGWSPTLLRVFLREEGDLELIRARVASEFGVAAPVMYLRGDICRADLLLEIDGVFSAG